MQENAFENTICEMAAILSRPIKVMVWHHTGAKSLFAPMVTHSIDALRP